LRVLSKVKPQDKVDVWDSNLYVTTPTLLRSLKRLICRQGRQASIEFIKKLICDAIEFSNALMNAKKQEQRHSGKSNLNFLDDYNNNIAWTNECNLKDLFEDLNKSRAGLENLKVTYGEDATAVSQIEVLSNNIDNQVKAIQKFMIQDNVYVVD
jgi:hypothetical protein